MRAWIGFAVLLVAACGEAPVEKAEAPVAAAPEPGEWELTSEVTAFQKVGEAPAKIDTPKGTRSTAKICVGAGAQLPTEFFSGEGFSCTYNDYYVRNGGINLALACVHKKLNEPVPISVNGSFDGASVTYDRSLRTGFSQGSVAIEAHVTGRRTGTCTPAAKAK
jgi:hypothetical protein